MKSPSAPLSNSAPSAPTSNSFSTDTYSRRGISTTFSPIRLTRSAPVFPARFAKRTYPFKHNSRNRNDSTFAAPHLSHRQPGNAMLGLFGILPLGILPRSWNKRGHLSQSRKEGMARPARRASASFSQRDKGLR